MKIHLAAFVLFVLSASFAFAQSDEDVVRYSLLTPGGTARSFGLAGATGALGGDYSCLSNNPGGIGLYHSSEFVFTPSLQNTNTKSSFQAEALNSQTTRFGFSNIGLIVNNKYKIRGKDVQKGWRSLTWGFGFNKLATFANTYSYGGYNRLSSIGDKFAMDLSNKSILAKNAYNADPWGSGLAYDAWLLDANYPDSTNYTACNAGGKVTQQMDISERGAVNEINFGLGANYEEKIYVGGSIGIPIVRYRKTIDYVETDDSLQHKDFSSLISSSEINTVGSGINLKMGVVYRFNDFFRIGAALHTPTYYSLTDNSTILMKTERELSGYHESQTDITTKYTVYSPWRFIGSMVVLFNKAGFLTVDYEYVDHSSSNIKFTNASATDNAAAHDINKILTKYYTTASNLRVGAEAKIDIFHIRAGYAIYGSPYKTALVPDYDQRMQLFSVGAGLREADYFFDVTFSRSHIAAINIPYTFASTVPSPLATITTNKNLISATIGFKF